MAEHKANDKKYKIAPGEAVGVLAAESLGEPSTQMVLRAFHSAGIASTVVVTGLPRIEEVIDAKKKPKSPIMIIPLSKEFAKDYEKAKGIRHKIEEVKLRNVIDGFSEDLNGGTMTLNTNREQMAEHEITSRTVVAKLSKIEGIDVTSDEGVIKIKIKGDRKKRSLKSSRTLFVNVRDTTVLGIPGIRKAMVQQNESTKAFYIMTSGSNMEEIINVEGVDKKHIYTNDIFAVMRVYGIEAARNLITYELKKTIEDEGLTVGASHVALVADAMTYGGTIKGVGRHGLAGNKESMFARAAFEETVKHFVNAGVFGEKDYLRGVAENIMIGKQISVGTGIVKLGIKKEDLKTISSKRK
jgi:DNA-directed RNA polymerase subunit A"